MTNGYLVAEIFSWYFPQEIQMYMYNNGTSLDSKVRNWSLLKNVCLTFNLFSYIYLTGIYFNVC